MRPSDSCLPIGPSSLCSQRTYRRSPAMISLPVRLTGNRRARGLVDRLTRGAEQTAGTDRPPRFLGNPKVPAPTSETPAGPPSQASTGEQARPPLARTAGAPTTRPISGLNGPARDPRGLRFARGVAPPGRKTRFRLLARLYRGAPGPLGSSERFLRCFLHRFPPFPGLPWRKRAPVRQTEASCVRPPG